VEYQAAIDFIVGHLNGKGPTTVETRESSGVQLTILKYAPRISLFRTKQELIIGKILARREHAEYVLRSDGLAKEHEQTYRLTVGRCQPINKTTVPTPHRL